MARSTGHTETLRLAQTHTDYTHISKPGSKTSRLKIKVKGTTADQIQFGWWSIPAQHLWEHGSIEFTGMSLLSTVVNKCIFS